MALPPPVSGWGCAVRTSYIASGKFYWYSALFETAGVAQWVAQLTCNQRGAGSSPVPGFGGGFLTPNELRQYEIDYCRDHILYYIKTYTHIEDKDAPELIQPFDLWPAQEEVVESLMSHRLNILLKARQLGFTWLVLAIASWLLRCWTGRTVIMLSRTEDEAMELIRRLGVILRNMPLIAEVGNVPAGWDGPTFRQTSLKLEIYFPDGPMSVAKAFASSPGAVRSFTADLLIFDEWAFQQWAKEIWTSAFPAINRPTGGRFFGISTIERGSLFEEIFTDPDNGFNKIFIPWYADPRRDEAWYESTKRALGDMMTQEYPATVEEALEVPGGAFFPEVRAKTHLTTKFPEGNVRRYACIDYGFDMFSCHWVAVDEYGKAVVYREYDSPDLTIPQACDIALSLTEGEYIEAWLAPPDLWSRNHVDGKSRAIVFQDNGLPLVKTLNRLEDGCAAMKEWLRPVGKEGEEKACLQFMEGAAPNLYRCLQKIQKDKNRPNIYAKEPHDLTHDVDSLRCFCVYWTAPANPDKKKTKKKWTPDMYEDYRNANEADKRMLLQKYGEPETW